MNIYSTRSECLRKIGGKSMRVASIFLFVVMIAMQMPVKAQTVWDSIVGDNSRNSSTVPIYTWYTEYPYTQQLYLASELSSDMANKPISKIAFKFYGQPRLGVWMDIYMVQVPSDIRTLGSGYYTAGLRRVAQSKWVEFRNPNSVENGVWVEIELDESFYWDGTSNIAVSIQQLSLSERLDCEFKCHSKDSMARTSLNEDATVPLRLTNVPQEMSGGVTTVLRHERPHIKFGYENCPANTTAFGFPQDVYTVDPGEPFTPPTPSGPSSGDVVYYTSSNPYVASVNMNTGEVSLTGQVGLVRITAEWRRSGRCAKFAHYDINVKDNCIIVGTGTGSGLLPFKTNSGYTWAQMIYKGAEIGESNRIHALSFESQDNNTTTRDVKIYLGRTNKEMFNTITEFVPVSELTLVYEGPLNIHTGWNRFEFNRVESFDYDMADNLVVAISTDLVDANGFLTNTRFYQTTTDDNTCIAAYTDEWRDMPEPTYYDGHWDEFPTPDDLHEIYLFKSRPNIDICTYNCRLRNGQFKYDTNEVMHVLQTPFHAPVLINTTGGTPRFSSSDETLATVTSDGTVTMSSSQTGEVIITATIEADAEYCANTAQYIVRAREFKTLTYNTEYNCTGDASPAPPDVVGLGMVVLSSEIPTCSDPNKVFVKWNTNRDGSGDDYYPGGSFPLLMDVTLYAIYGSPCCIADSALVVTYVRNGRARDTLHRSPDGYYNFDLCKHETLTVRVDAKDGSGCSLSNPQYKFQYANLYMPKTVMGNEFVPPAPDYSPTFDSVVGYDLIFKATVPGCEGNLIVMPGRIRVSDGIKVKTVMDEPFTICPGMPSDISVGYVKNGVDFIRVDRSHPLTNAVDGHKDTIYLPDGMNCRRINGETGVQDCMDDDDPANSGGCSYISSVNFYQFRENSVIRSNSDIRYLKLNIEHSYIGDLSIQLICPENASGVRQSANILKLKQYQDADCNCSSTENVGIGWSTLYGQTQNANAHFGITREPENEAGHLPTDVQACDPDLHNSHIDNRPGTGYEYIWSCAKDLGYTYTGYSTPATASSDIRKAKVYYKGNQTYTTNNDAWLNSTATSSTANCHKVYIVKPSNSSGMTNIYYPDDEFKTALRDCPFNGEWSIKVQDGYKCDNGWLFSWELALCEDSLRDVWGYNAELDSVWLSCGTWDENTITNDHVTLTPPANFTGGTVDCNITTIDNFGCRNDSIAPFVFDVRELILSVHDTMCDCDGNGGKIWIEVPDAYADHQPFTFYLDPVFDPDTSINPADMVSYAQGPTSLGRFRDVLYGSNGGWHDVYALDNYGCPRLESHKIDKNRITGVLAESHNATCVGSDNGSFRVTASTTQTITGNVFTYTVNELGSNQTGIFNNVPAGTYSVVITDAFNSCSYTLTPVEIGTDIPLLTLVDDTLRQPLASGCPLAAGGSYALSADVNGTGTYSYEWRAGRDGMPVTITAGTPSGTHTSATIPSDGDCGTYFDTLIVTETVHHCVDTFTSSFITIATPPSIAVKSGLDANKDWGCDAGNERFVPSAASFTVTDACNPSAVATVTAGTEVDNGCHHSNYWAAAYSNSCGMAAAGDTIRHAWLVTTKPTFDAMPVVAAVAKGSDCAYTIPDLTNTVLPRTTGCEAAGLRVLSQSPASLTERRQNPLKNDTIDVTVIVRDTCGDTAHAHVQVVIPRDSLVISTNLSTTTNTIDTSACTGYAVSTTLTVANPSGTEESVWSSMPAGFSRTNPSYPLELNPGNPDTTYHVVVTDANGCTASADVHVALNPDPVITPVTGYDELEQSICEGKEIDTIKVKIENAYYDPSSTIGSAAGVTVTVRHHDAAPDTVIITGKPEGTGTYTLATISNQSPVCDAKSAEIKFNVTDTIEPVIVTAVGGTSGKDTVCITSATSLTDTVMTIRETAGVDGDSWSWTVDGGTIISGSDGREITVKWTSGGNKTVTVTVTHGALNCRSVKSKIIYVQPVPTIDVSSIAGGGDEVTICPNRDTLSFNTTLGGADGTATYTYTYGGDLTFAQVVNDSRDTATIPNVCGVDYRVGVTAMDNHGCSVTDSMTVHASDVTAPTFTTPGTWGTLVQETGCDLTVLTNAHPTVHTAAGLQDTLGVTVADLCTPLSQLTLTSRDSVMTEGVTCGHKIRRYYVVTDLCGNKDSIYEEIYVQFPTSKPTVDAIAAVTATPKTSECKYLIPDLSGTVLANAHGNCGDAYLRIIEQSPAALEEYLQNPNKNDTIDVMIAVKDTCSDSAQVHVKVVIPQDTVHLMTNLSLTTNRVDTSACLGEQVSLTATVTQPNGTEHVYWTSTPAGFTHTDPSYPIGLGPDTTYQAVVIDNNGCTDTAKIRVDLNPSPVITPLAGYDELTQSICLGDSIDTIKVEIRNATYDATSSIGTAERVTVENRHHAEAGVYDTVLVFGNPKDTNEYWIRVLSDQSPACNKDSVKITFNVADTVKPVIVTEVGGVANKDTVCISSSTSLTNNVMTIRETATMVGDSYAWTVDGGTITSGAGTREITVAWTSEGDKTVTVSVTRGACTSKATKQIYVQPVPTLTMDNDASGDYDAGTDTYPICPNRDTLSFNTTLGGADGTATYTYTYGGAGVTFVQQVHDSRDTATIPHTCGVDYRVGVTVMDNHGCSVTDSMTISAIDTTAPTVTAAGGGKELAEVDIDGCTSDLTTLYPAVTTPTALHNDLGVVLDDNCIESSALIVSHRDSVFASVTCGYRIRRYYVVTDSCGNQDSVYQHINVHIAEHAFTISDVPTEVEIGCVDSAVGLNYNYTRIVLPTVTDGCGHTITPDTYTPTPVMTGRVCMDTTKFTYTYRDCEGHDTTWTFTYNVTLRELSMNNPTELVDTLPCTNAALEAVSFNTPSGEMRDACGRVVTPIPVDENGDPIDDGLGGQMTTATPVINVDGTGNGTVVYNWKYTDCSGREYIWRRKHVIKPDAFDGYPNDTVTVTCIGLITEPAKPSEEVCGNAIAFDDFIRDSVASDRGCYMITYTSHYVVFAQDYYYTYAYIYNPPAFSIPANTENRTLQCIADTVAPGPGDLPTVRHAGCEGGIDEYITPTGPVRTIKGDGCKDTVIYTYHYEDCARSGDWSYIYYIVPTTAPHEVLNPETGTMAARSGDAQCFDSCYADKDTIWGATLPIIVSQCGDTLATPVPTRADTLTDATHDNVTGTRTYHYVYTDCTGANTYEWTYRFDVSRHTDPHEVPQDPMDPTSLVDTVANVKCDSMAVRPTLPTVVDVCGNVLEPYADSSVVRTNHHCQDTVTYYYNYYDPSYIPGVDYPANELAYHWYFRYYIDRTQMPEIVEDVTPNYDTVDCFADAVLPSVMPVVLDGCLDTLVPFDTIRDEHHDTRGGNELCTGYVKYTFKYKDCTNTNVLPWEYTRYVAHPLLTPDVPDTVTENYTCVNAAMAYEPHPDTLVNQCGDTIRPVADPLNPIVSLVHDTGTVIYHYTYTDCDDSVYDWAYVCNVTPEQFNPPADSLRQVSCISDTATPRADQRPDFVDCMDVIPMKDSTVVLSDDFDNHCGTVSFRYHYDVHGITYEWNYVYEVEPPEFVLPPDSVNIDLECIRDTVLPVLEAVSDGCGGTLQPLDTARTVISNGCKDTVIYTFHYKDCAGREKYWHFQYNIAPTTVPHEVLNPETGSMASRSGDAQCFDSCYADKDTIWGATLPIIVSQCGDTLETPVPTYADTLTDATHDNVTGTRTYHYVYTDCTGENTYEWTYRFDVSRHTDPHEVPQDPSDPTSFVDTVAYVNCDTLVVRPTLPTVVDVCGNVVEPYADSSIVRTDHNCKDTVTYYYNYYDPSYIPGVDGPADELAYHWYFRYYIDKGEEPTVVQGFNPDHDTVPCFDSASRPTQTPVVIDACGEQLTPVIDSVDTHTNDDQNNCTGYRTFNYVYTDCSGTHDVTLNYIRYVEHPALIVPDNDTVAYTCANAAMNYRPTPDTLTNHCGDVIVPDSISRTSYLNEHDSGYVSYQYRYTDCDGRTYDWYYVCDVRPDEFHPPIDSARTVNCLAQATVPTAAQYPDIEDCGVRIPFDQQWDSGEYPDTTYSSGFNDTCGYVTYTYTYTIHGEQYTWSYVYEVDPPEFTIPDIDTIDTIECYNVNDPAVVPTLPVVINSCGDTINSSETNPPVLVIDSSDYVANDRCHGNIVYNYTYTDCGGNTIVWQFTYVVHHTTTPHIVGTEPDTVSSVACFLDATETFVVPEVEDVCGLTIERPQAEVTEGGTDCEGWRNYKYTFVDCDNVPYVWNYRYIVHDTVAPHIDVDALMNMAETQSVARNNCQYSMPDLSDVTLRATSDVASEHCSSETFFVEQTPPSTELFHQPMDDSTVTVRLVVRDACNNRDTAYVDIVIPGSHITVDVLSVDENNQTSQTGVICAGQSILLQAQANSTNGEQQYVWTPTEGLTAIAGNQAMAAPMQDIQYTVTFTDNNGCTASDVINMTVHQLTSTGYTVVACDQYTWDNNGNLYGPYTVSDTYYNTYLTADGCTSVDTLYLTVNYNSSTNYVVDDACDRYEWNGTTYTLDGVYTSQVYYTPENCPSVDTLTLTLLRNTSTGYVAESCDSYDWDRGNQTLGESGTYYYSYNNDAGCPSVDTLHLVIHRSSVTDLSATACDHYEWYGQHFGASTQAEHHLNDYYGCDSLLRIDITIYYSDSYQYGDTICAGESYMFFNRSLIESGTYENVIRTVHGCDSTISLYLLVVPRPAVRIGYEYDCKAASYTVTAQTSAHAFQWHSVPNVAGLSEQATERSITVSPTHLTLFTVLAGFEGLMQCAVMDTISLNPVSVVDAQMEVNPTALYRELLDWNAVNRTQTETWHQWYVDDIYYGDDNEIYGTASDKVDSVVLVLIAGSDQCTDTSRVVLPMLREGLYVPNVFTPELKINRKFGAVGIGIIRFQMDVYNRSGIHVFHSEDIHDWWDGSHKGVPCTNGSYVYRIVYSTEVYPDVKNEITGQVMLLR